MTAYVPIVKNDANGAIFYVTLLSQTTSAVFQTNPTLAAGDVKISIDGAASANLATLPVVTPAAGKAVKVTLSQAETNGDNLAIVFSDVAGAEWCDLFINIQTAARHIDDLAFPATSGRSIVVDAAGLVDANMVKVGPSGSGTAQTARDIGASVLLSTGTGTGQLDFTAGVVKANLAQILGTALTETAGQIAAAFKKWFDVASPTGTVNSIPGAVAGASGGLLISGSNVGTTTLGALTVTGSATISDGLLVSRSTLNTPAISATGNGTGHGILATGGANNANGIRSVGAGNASGIASLGAGTGAGLTVTGGATGNGVSVNGGATSGIGLAIATTSGDGLSILPTAGNGIVATANGTSKHGFVITGGTAGTSDGLKAVAGAGGVDFRANTTGDRTGNVSGSVGSVTAAVTITAASVQAIWDALTSALTTVGSIGKLLVTNIDAAISSRLATAGYTAPLDAAGTRAAVGLASANLDTQIATLATPAQVKAQAVAALATDTYAEPGQGTPAATNSLAAKIGYIMKAWLNKSDQNATLYELYNAAGAVVDQKATVSDDGTTFTKGGVVSGP